MFLERWIMIRKLKCGIVLGVLAASLLICQGARRSHSLVPIILLPTPRPGCSLPPQSCPGPPNNF